MEYGYARVSSKDQNLDRQLDALRAFPVAEQCIYADRCSGATFERPRYQELVERFSTGDVLVVKSIDRLGRSYEEILEQWRYLVRRKGVDIVVLDMPLLDTRAVGDAAREDVVPNTGDASIAVSGIALVGAALAGAGALLKRRR